LKIHSTCDVHGTRHVEIKHKKLLEWIKAKIFALEYVASADNLADFFTKPGKRPSFLANRNALLVKVRRGQRDDEVQSNEIAHYQTGSFEEEEDSTKTVRRARIDQRDAAASSPPAWPGSVVKFGDDTDFRIKGPPRRSRHKDQRHIAADWHPKELYEENKRLQREGKKEKAKRVGRHPNRVG